MGRIHQNSRLISFSRLLTLGVVVALALVVTFFFLGSLIAANSYGKSLLVTSTKSSPTYDFSCNEYDYQIFFQIRNNGSKNVVGLQITITNPLCVGGIPHLPDSLNRSGPGSELSFYAQTTAQNGSLTVSGNDTILEVNF